MPSVIMPCRNKSQKTSRANSPSLGCSRGGLAGAKVKPGGVDARPHKNKSDFRYDVGLPWNVAGVGAAQENVNDRLANLLVIVLSKVPHRHGDDLEFPTRARR